MAQNVQFDRNKLKAAVLLICEACPPDRLGAVKFHKALYFADMLQYATSRRPLTGATYRKRPYGPTCEQLLPTLAELSREGAVEISDVDYFGYRKKEYRALRSASEGVLSDDEIALLREIVGFVCHDNTAATISEFSHQAPWERAEFGAEIPYTTAYQLFPSIVSEEALAVTARGAEEIETARQAGASLGYRNFEVFRRSLRKTGSALSA